MSINVFSSQELSGIGIGPSHGIVMARLNELIVQVNTNTGAVGTPDPFNYAGDIAVAADFPTSAAVATGDVHRVTADVQDNDATKTNTSQTFLAGSEIAWNGVGWDILGPNVETGIVTTSTTPYNVADGVHTVLVDTATIAGASVVNLPALSVLRKGRKITVIDIGSLAATHNIAVTPDGTDEIDGVNAAKTISTNDGAIAIETEGVAWWTTISLAHAQGDGSDHSFIDQSVVSGSTPVFAVTNFTGSAAGLDSDATAHAAADGTSHTFIDQTVVSGAAPVFAATNFTGTKAGIDSDSATHIASNGSDHTFLDQSVISGSTPIFAVTNFTGSAAGIDSDATAHAAADGSSHTFLDQSVINGSTPIFAVTNFTGSAAGLDSDATAHAAADGTSHTFIDQTVVSGASPVFAVTNFTGSAAGLDSSATAHAAADGTSHTFIDQTVVSGASPVFAVTNMTGTAAGLDSDATAHAASAGISHSYIQNNIVDALVTYPNAGSGGTTSAGTIQVKDLAGSNLAKVCVVLLLAADAEFAGDLDVNANVSFSDTGAGSILGSGTGWAVVKTDNTGLAEITATNAADETVWMHVATAQGTDVLADGVLVRGCIPDDATWSA